MSEEQMMPQREAYWGELDDKQKIERMREHVRRLEARMSDLQEQVRKLLGHSHDQQGNPTVVIGFENQPMNLWQELKDDEPF